MSDFRVNTKLDLKKKTGQKGQISVFLALGFLVLFTMFAMTINVGMVVHDKINIQNATDFAAIYVAQRQAEMLNAIAHMNYQIRQAHKLLAYRYVVLGSAGIERTQVNQGYSADEGSPDPSSVRTVVPLCTADSRFLRFPGTNTDEWCRQAMISGGFGGIPILRVVNPRVGGNFGLRSQTQEVARGVIRGAALASSINWWFTANAMSAFRYQIAYRKALIRALASNMARPIQAGPQGMRDLYGDSVFDGAEKTFSFNLSESIRRSGGFSVQVRNSMENLAPSEWLPEIPVYMVPTYVDYSPAGGGASVGGRIERAQRRFYIELPDSYVTDYDGARSFVDTRLFNSVDPSSIISSMAFIFPAPPGDDFEEIMGVEKNPWYMVYAQVESEVISGALFSPLPTVRLQAQSFAKPFGGRIGPWHGRDWQQGSPQSSGQKVEPLWPPRKVGTALPTDPGDATLLPNIAKYPGDTIGLQSRLAQSSTGIIGDNGANVVDAGEFFNITFDLMPGGTGQALTQGLGQMRARELSALAPDLFDITYYSIEPNFHENYLEGKLDTWLMSGVTFNRGMTYEQRIWRDIGASSLPAEQQLTIKDQMRSPSRQSFAARVFYFLEGTPEGFANLLTSWVGGTDVMDYRTPSSGSVATRFGRCGTFFNPGGNRPNVPGECLAEGGRAGYSVKIVSKEYLESAQHRMTANSVGALLNPPTN